MDRGSGIQREKLLREERTHLEPARSAERHLEVIAYERGDLPCDSPALLRVKTQPQHPEDKRVRGREGRPKRFGAAQIVHDFAKACTPTPWGASRFRGPGPGVPANPGS